MLPPVFDALAVETHRTRIDELAECSRNVDVHLSQVERIDSSGIGALITLYRRVADTGAKARFLGATGQPRRIFELLHLAHLLDDTM